MSRVMYDEMHAAPEQVRAHYQAYADWLAQQPEATMAARRAEAEMIFRRVGITFAVYGAKDEDGAGTERLIPASPRSTALSTTSTTAKRSSRPVWCRPIRFSRTPSSDRR